MILWVAAALAAPWPIGDIGAWDIDVQVLGPEPSSTRAWGPPIAGFMVSLACVGEPPTRRTQLTRCSVLGDRAELGHAQGDQLVMSTLALPEHLVVEATWRSDGRLARVHLAGDEPEGLGDWIRLALGGLELQRPPSWAVGTAWRQAGAPVAMSLAGTASTMATTLTHTVVSDGAEGVVVRSEGMGMLLPEWVQDLLGRAKGRIDVSAVGSARVAPDHVSILSRSFSLQLSSADGSEPGSLGAQRIVVAQHE